MKRIRLLAPGVGTGVNSNTFIEGTVNCEYLPHSVQRLSQRKMLSCSSHASRIDAFSPNQMQQSLKTRAQTWSKIIQRYAADLENLGHVAHPAVYRARIPQPRSRPI